MTNNIEIVHGFDCWPPTRCVDPDNCPMVYALLMQEYHEGFDIDGYFGKVDPETGRVHRFGAIGKDKGKRALTKTRSKV